MFKSILKILLITGVPALAWAQTPVYVDVSQCRNISVDLARVACYDRLADQAMKPDGAAPAVGRDSALQAAPQGNLSAQMREKNRKMREELARLRKSEAGGGSDAERADRIGKSDLRVEMDNKGRDILYDRITALQRGPDGWIITLSSGQVWKQMYNRRYALKEGQQVKIEPGILGSRYHLTVSDLKSFIDVERLR